MTPLRATCLRLTVLAMLASPALAQEPQLDRAEDVTIFDGRTLGGWRTEGGPYDGAARWTVEDGAIVGREGEGGAGGLLYSPGVYRNFIFSADVLIDHPCDSGIFVRMAEKGRGAQVTLDNRPGGEIAAVYSDGYLAHNETAKKRLRQKTWNRFTVRCTGHPFTLTTWLNGERVMHYRQRDAKGFASEGRIGLQVHGGGSAGDGVAVRFRDLRVRRLPDFDPRRFSSDDLGFLTPTEAGRESGWRSLLDGRDLEGWEPVGGDESGYVVRDGVLMFPREGGDGYLRTKEDFRDFELRLDFKIAYMANSGLFLRAARDGTNPAYSGCEVQILDDFNWERVTKTKLKPWQLTGSLYGSVPRGVAALRPLGQWNTYEVRYAGSRLKVALNGARLYDVDTFEVPGKPFRERAAEGAIGLQRHAPSQVRGEAYAWFRNIFVRPLKEGER